MRDRLEAFEEADDLGAGPFLCADEFAADDALAVDDVGLGPHLGMKELGGGLAGIADGDQIHVVTSNKARIGVGVFIDADGNDGNAGQLVVEGEERGGFLNAGHAPGGPEVDEDDLTTVAGEMDGGGAVGEGEVGGRLAGLRRMRAAVAGGQQGKWQQGGQNEATRKPHILIIRSGRAMGKR